MGIINATTSNVEILCSKPTMNEKNLFSNAIAALNNEGVETFNWESIKDSPEIQLLGQNRGLPFSFLEGETLTFQPLNEAVFFTTLFKQGEKTYKVLKTLAVSDKRGVIRVPASSFCRLPSLEEERTILFDDTNVFGRALAEAESDYLRLYLCCEAGTVKVLRKLVLHCDRWVRNKETGENERIPDSADAINRKTLNCYQFSK